MTRNQPHRMARGHTRRFGLPSGEQVWRATATRAGEGEHPLTHKAFKIELLKRTVLRVLEQVEGRV
jgi:CO/xanthine dehydrogenase FAD-binding subunit